MMGGSRGEAIGVTDVQTHVLAQTTCAMDVDEVAGSFASDDEVRAHVAVSMRGLADLLAELGVESGARARPSRGG